MIGDPIDRVDGRAKVTGTATYANDTPVAGALYAVLATSRIARGRFHVDAAAAAAVPGVVAIVMPDTAPRLPAAPPAGNGDRVLQLLQDELVWYQDQPIAIAIADTLEHAQHAATLVDARYVEEPPIADLVQALGDAFKPAAGGPVGEPDTRRGDVDAALARAPVRFHATYTTPIENHNPMEPHATTAVWSGEQLTVYDATQHVYGVRNKLARTFGIPAQNVRCIDRFVGGAFGCKGSVWSHVLLAAMAAKVAGKPVKLVVTRTQMFSIVGHRPKTVQAIALGATRDGKLVAVRHAVTSETSRFDDFIEPSAVATRMLYSCANVETSHRLVRVDAGTPTFMRAPGESSGEFAIESAMDELAIAAGLDPLELRLRNYAERDEHEGKPFSSKSLRECYARAADAFGWAKRTAAPRSMTRGDRLVGWGMASATYPARMLPATARVTLRADGSANVQIATADLGTGTYTILAQVAADTLGIAADKVSVEIGDSALPEAPVAAGSMTASSAGQAVKLACEEAKRQLVPNLPEVTATHHSEEYEGRAGYSCHAFGAAFAEVEVDEPLGVVRVTRLVGAYACGRILNPKTAHSQLMGGLVWAVGMTLEEQTVRDRRTARVMTRDLADYHVPVNADIGDIDVSFVDEHDPHVNALGTKGLGEIGLCGATAAIANAVFHATGKRVRDLPITLDKLL